MPLSSKDCWTMSKKRPSHPEEPISNMSADWEADASKMAIAENAELAGDDPNMEADTLEQAPEAFAELREEADRLVQEVAEANEKYLRVAAELENTRRRAQADLSEARKFAIKDFAEEIVNVRDSLELAQAWDPDGSEADPASIHDGLQTTLKQLDQALEKFAIKVVAPEPGDKLDPNLHQAMTMQESAEIAPNHILSVIRKGYTINERLLRPAMVVVARTVEAQTAVENNAEQPEDA